MQKQSKKSKKSTLTIECSEWAEKFAANVSASDFAIRFYAFKPNFQLAPGASFLGEFTNDVGERFAPQPDWQWHVAVEINGRLHDEVHPLGVTTETYLNFFRHIDIISFTVHDDLESAIDSASSWIKPRNL